MNAKSGKLIVFFLTLGIACFAIAILPAQAVKISDPLGTSSAGATDLISTVIKSVLGIVGALALAVCIYGGVIILTAAGKPDAIKKGWSIVTWAIVGLAVIFTSYTVLNFVVSNLSQGVPAATTTTAGGTAAKKSWLDPCTSNDQCESGLCGTIDSGIDFTNTTCKGFGINRGERVCVFNGNNPPGEACIPVTNGKECTTSCNPATCTCEKSQE